MSRFLRGAWAISMALLIATIACEREQRAFEGRSVPASLAPENVPSPYQRNAWGLGEGKRLFTLYNCSGCHANGGGAIGPALMDDEWIYGDRPADIHETILDGRPNGMPSYRGKIPDDQVWQLVAYVQAMSGHVPLDAAPGRSDHLRVAEPEAMRDDEPSVQTGHK